MSTDLNIKSNLKMYRIRLSEVNCARRKSNLAKALNINILIYLYNSIMVR